MGQRRCLGGWWHEMEMQNVQLMGHMPRSGNLFLPYRRRPWVHGEICPLCYMQSRLGSLNDAYVAAISIGEGDRQRSTPWSGARRTCVER